MKKFLKFIFFCACAALILLGLSRITMVESARSNTFDIALVPAAQVALVPGAGITADGRPTLALRDRIDGAIELYRAGKVQKILMSGDNSTIYYNEPGVMANYAIQQGIPESDIVLDYAGRRTYDTCYRAKEIFGLESVIITTQKYHLPRMVFLCEQLGLNTTGIPVEQSNYLLNRYILWNVREVLATLAAYLDIYILKPEPILGSPEPIFVP
ncbi:MAG TPA: ElyC/SanA/YdcF family protein [Anaerolineaceae bacterium]|nr:ElyC/SanA/YdcF family protein [Anaerolineaceae bacterium]